MIVKPILRLENVNLYAKLTNRQRLDLKGQAILQDISFSVPHSSHTAIVGPSGSGKSFLLRLLNRLIEPSQGKIYWEETPYSRISPLDLRQRVVLAPQIPKLLGMNVEDALTYPLQLRKLQPRNIQQRLEYWLSCLQIPDDWRSKNELQLSTGQIQLVAIARALITQPPVLLLDEPTAHLDLKTANRLMQVLHQIGEIHNTTVIMVNHQIDRVQEFCQNADDLIIHLNNARIANHQTAASVDWHALKISMIQAQSEDEFAF